MRHSNEIKNLILVDWKVTLKTDFWLKEELEKIGIETELLGIPNYNVMDEKSKFGKIRLWIKYFKLSISGIRKTKKNDVIISWNFVVGAITGFFCNLFGLKRKIIALNMIAHEKGLLNTIFRKIIYNKAFKYCNFWFSVNDEQLISSYSVLFKFPTDRIFVLHDVFYKTDEQSDYKEVDDYVFTGGDAFRDWNSLIECASDLSDINFIGVARKKNFPAEKKLPENLKMYFDISYDEFYSILKKCLFVFLPLNSTAPCGLIVLIKAGLLSKPIIITETISTKNYIQNEFSGKLIKRHDLKQMKESLLQLSIAKDLRIKYAENFKNYLLKNFSTEKNAKIISTVIMK